MSATDQIMSILSSTPDAREAFEHLVANVPAKIAQHQPDTLAGTVEAVRRYASRVAKAENQKRGRDAGATGAIGGSTGVSVVRDYATRCVQGDTPAAAWAATLAQCEYTGGAQVRSDAAEAFRALVGR